MKSDPFSKTAAYVAIKFYGLSQIEQYRELFDRDVITFYDRLVASLPTPLNRYHTLLKNDWFRSASIFIDEAMLPGDLMHILMRKYYISSTVDRLIQEDYSQILILGAGFDHIAAIYSQKGISCIELDTVSVLKIKQHFLETNSYSNNKHTLHPVDINRTQLSYLLPSIPDIDPDAHTIAIAEGFFDYITPKKFSEALHGLHSFFNSELKILSTVFSLQQLTQFHAFVFKYAVKAVGEKLQLHANLEEFQNYFRKNNFLVEHLWDADKLKNDNPVLQASKMDVLPGFYILEASKDG